MAGLNLSQVRVIDPVLTQIAQGYKQSELVGYNLFPKVPVGLRGGNIITFGKEDFMQYVTARAPGENTRRVQFGYSGSPFALIDYSLEGMVPIEVYQEGVDMTNGWAVDHMDLAMKKVEAIMALRLEIQQAALARTAASYQAANKITLSGTGQWSDQTSGISTPMKNIETAKEAVRAATGKRANTVVMGAAVLAQVRTHPLVVDRMKYTGRDIVTADLLASLFGVARVLIGDAIYSNDAGTTFTDVWGKDVVVAYTDLSTVADMGAPSYGYTYNLNGYPVVEIPYFDRNAKSWFVPVTRAEAPVIAAVNAGYLITNAVA